MLISKGRIFYNFNRFSKKEISNVRVHTVSERIRGKISREYRCVGSGNCWARFLTLSSSLSSDEYIVFYMRPFVYVMYSVNFFVPRVSG